MTVYACPFPHPDGLLVWGEPLATYEMVASTGVDPIAAMVTRLLPWVAYSVSNLSDLIVADSYGVLEMTDRYGPTIAYYTAIGDKERLRVALGLRVAG